MEEKKTIFDIVHRGNYLKKQTSSDLNLEEKHLDISQDDGRKKLNQSRLNSKPLQLIRCKMTLKWIFLVIGIIYIIAHCFHILLENTHEIKLLKEDIERLKHELENVMDNVNRCEKTKHKSSFIKDNAIIKAQIHTMNTNSYFAPDNNIVDNKADKSSDESDESSNESDESSNESNNEKRNILRLAKDTAIMKHVPKKFKIKRKMRTGNFLTKHQHNSSPQAKMTMKTMDSDKRTKRDDNYKKDSALDLSTILEIDGKIHPQNQNVRKDNYTRRSMNVETSNQELTRRNIHPHQIYAINYVADHTLASANDEYTGNGRLRHSNDVFKAWRTSDWVTDFGMNQFFKLDVDGKLIIYESGLYLVYAQINYLDKHEKYGFQLLVNDRPTLYCTLYSPGITLKSNTCFSAKLIVLQSGDSLILRNIESASYTVFQDDKSFFGLIKIGNANYYIQNQAKSEIKIQE